MRAILLLVVAVVVVEGDRVCKVETKTITGDPWWSDSLLHPTVGFGSHQSPEPEDHGYHAGSSKDDWNGSKVTHSATASSDPKTGGSSTKSLSLSGSQPTYTQAMGPWEDWSNHGTNATIVSTLCTVKVVSTKTTTSISETSITLPPLTTTTTAIEISTSTVTGEQETDTYTTTSTISDTTTITEETVSPTTTIVDTATVTSASVTIPPPPGITPFEDSPGPQPSNIAKRGTSSPANGPVMTSKIAGQTSCTSTTTSVVSTTEVTLVVTTTVEVEGWTSTLTETSIITTTSTVLPTPASVTVTRYDTVTVPTTTTTTATTTISATETAVVAIPTYYAACAPNNRYPVEDYIGLRWDATRFELHGSLPGGLDGYDCCVSCLQEPRCVVAVQENRYGCAHYLARVEAPFCDGAAPVAQLRISPGSSDAVLGHASNSGCGQWRFEPL